MITRILIEHLKKKEKIQSKEQTILLEQIMGIEAILGLLFIVVGLIPLMSASSTFKTPFYPLFFISLLYGFANLIITIFHLANRDVWNWSEFQKEFIRTEDKAFNKNDGYNINFKVSSPNKILYSISKNGISYKEEEIKEIGITTENGIFFTPISNLLNFIKEHDEFPYTKIEPINLFHILKSPYVKENYEIESSSILLSVPQTFLTELKSYIHKDLNYIT